MTLKQLVNTVLDKVTNRRYRLERDIEQTNATLETMEIRNPEFWKLNKQYRDLQDVYLIRYGKVYDWHWGD